MYMCSRLARCAGIKPWASRGRECEAGASIDLFWLSTVSAARSCCTAAPACAQPPYPRRAPSAFGGHLLALLCLSFALLRLGLALPRETESQQLRARAIANTGGVCIQRMKKLLIAITRKLRKIIRSRLHCAYHISITPSPGTLSRGAAHSSLSEQRSKHRQLAIHLAELGRRALLVNWLRPLVHRS